MKSTNIKKFKELLAEHFEKIHPSKSKLASSYSERPTFIDSHPFKSMLSANHVMTEELEKKPNFGIVGNQITEH